MPQVLRRGAMVAADNGGQRIRRGQRPPLGHQPPLYGAGARQCVREATPVCLDVAGLVHVQTGPLHRS